MWDARKDRLMSQTQPIDVTARCWDCGEVRLYEEIACCPEDFSYACGNSTCAEYGQKVGWLPDLCCVISSPEKAVQQAKAKVLRDQLLAEARKDCRLGFTLAERTGQTYQPLPPNDGLHGL